MANFAFTSARVLDSLAQRSPKCKKQKVYRCTGGKFFVYSLHSRLMFKLRTPRRKRQQVYRWQFFCLLFAKVWDSQAKRSPKCKTQPVYRWRFFLYCLHMCWIFKLEEHPMRKHQHVYRWQFFGFMSAHVLDSQTKRSDKCKNQRVLDSQAKGSDKCKKQQVYRWQIFC